MEENLIYNIKVKISWRGSLIFSDDSHWYYVTTTYSYAGRVLLHFILHGGTFKGAYDTTYIYNIRDKKFYDGLRILMSISPRKYRFWRPIFTSLSHGTITLAGAIHQAAPLLISTALKNE